MTALDDFNNAEQAHVVKPIELYEFSRQSGSNLVYWRYTSHSAPVATAVDVVYQPLAIMHDDMKQSSDPTSSSLNVTMPYSSDFIQAFRGAGSVPSDSVYLTIFRTHDTDDGADRQAIWVGTVSSVRQTDNVTAELGCQTLSAQLQSSGLRLGWQRSCPHMLYDKRCKVDPNDFKLAGAVTGLTGNQAAVAEFNGHDADLEGGYCEWILTDGSTERRGITNHSADTITIIGSFANLEVGTTLTAYFGCDRSGTACRDKFDNLPNFGGFTKITGTNIFNGEVVF